MTDAAAAEPLVDPERLRGSLAAELGLELKPGELRLVRISGGQSNLTYRVEAGGRQLVLRRPPPGPLPPSAHDVLREYRLLTGLAGSQVPVPKPLLACSDPAVLGAPFYLMECVPGETIRYHLPERYAGSTLVRRRASEELVDTLAALHLTDPAAVGLADLGRPDGYLQRQVRRWTGQLEYARVRALPDLEWLAEWLAAHLPAEEQPTAIVHGDYRLDNALFDLEPPVRLLALVDWEMSTLGDPLADLGYLLAGWREHGDEPPPLAIFSRVTEEPGFISRAELVARYQARVQRQLPDLTFYVVLALWKMAIFFEGHWARHLGGTAGEFDFGYLEDGNPAFAAHIRRLAESAG